jgi:hypothetical protein
MRINIRIMQYFRKIKYTGNPNPKNSNSLEFEHRGTSYFSIGFKQHLQKIPFPALLMRLCEIPGLLALA